MYYYCNIIDNKSEIDSKMYGYIHNHTAFDEIVPHDSENNEEMPQLQNKVVRIVRTKKGKPFWISRKFTEGRQDSESPPKTQNLSKLEKSTVIKTENNESFREEFLKTIKCADFQKQEEEM